MSVFLALIFVALITGVFFGLATSRGPHRLPGKASPPPPPELPAADQLPGADPSRAIAVDSPAVIDERAAREPCPVCGARVHCEHHRVEQVGDRRFRVAQVDCPRCGFARDVWFTLS